MNFGENLKRMRIEHEYTLEKLGYMLGVSPQAVFRWEVGKTEPNMRTVAKICEIFNCTADELAGIYSQPLSKDERDVVLGFREASEEVKSIVRTILKPRPKGEPKEEPKTIKWYEDKKRYETP